jgi:hypothetical protein
VYLDSVKITEGHKNCVVWLSQRGSEIAAGGAAAAGAAAEYQYI